MVNIEAYYTKQAESFLEKQTERQATRIKQAVNNLPMGDVKKLKGIENAYRLRVGSVRVLFEKHGNEINVIKIDSRGGIYKK